MRCNNEFFDRKNNEGARMSFWHFFLCSIHQGSAYAFRKIYDSLVNSGGTQLVCACSKL